MPRLYGPQLGRSDIFRYPSDLAEYHICCVGNLLRCANIVSAGPGPICRSGCGRPCIGLFCHWPCLLNCIDGPNDFEDSNDPDPPDRPPRTIEPDPEPTEPVDDNPLPDPEDPFQFDPQDIEEEDEVRASACFILFLQHP